MYTKGKIRQGSFPRDQSDPRTSPVQCTTTLVYAPTTALQRLVKQL